MLTTQFTVYKQHGKEQKAHVSVHPEYDTRASCTTAADQAPIFSVTDANISITVSAPKRSHVGEIELSFAYELARAADVYLAESIRLHAIQAAEAEDTDT